MTSELDEESHEEKDYQQAIHALMETMTAMLATQARLEGTVDRGLRDILIDDVGRTKERVIVILEWMRQRDPLLDAHMRAILFQQPAPSETSLDDVSEETALPAPAPAPVAMPPEPAPAPVPAPPAAQKRTLTSPMALHTRIRG